MKNSRLPLIAALLCALSFTPALARPDLCESAAVQAARDNGVPVDVLMSVTLAETGRTRGGRLRPWPWAVNAEGQGHWFDTYQQALRFARDALARGQRNFDLGCFQINWRWHGDQFASPAALLDPPTAARYAARMLARFHDEFGDWEAAAGAYHSRTPVHAARYRARFARIRQQLARSMPRAGARQVTTPATGTRVGENGGAPGQPDRPVDRTTARSAAHANAGREMTGREMTGREMAPQSPLTPQAPPAPLFAGTVTGASLVPARLAAARPLIELRP